MDSIDSVRETSSPQQREMNYRGRVRTGCLVCRSRKIKCDEKRPSCQRCTKSERRCIYKHAPPLMPLNPAPPNVNYVQHRNGSPKVPLNSPRQTRNRDPIIHQHLISPECSPTAGESVTLNISEDTAQPSQKCSASVDEAAPSCDHGEISSFHYETDLNGAESSPLARCYSTSLQIYVTTTIDWLGPSGMPSKSFSYFIEEVDCPILSPFDYLGWERIKLHATQLAAQDESIAAAILAAQGVYRAQVNRLPMFHATSAYQAALDAFELTCGNNTIGFDAIMVLALLLCVCEVTLPNEDGPTFRGFGQAFETRLTVWLLSANRSPVSLRICAWLQLLHVATKRVGCCGLLPETVFDLLSHHIVEVPYLSQLGNYTDSASALYDTISGPVFAFYLELQKISNQVQDLSHYRRSRITPADQAEVTDIVTRLKSTLSNLWNTRPNPLRFQPRRLRENFSRTIAEPLVALVGVCTAAYFGEVVGLRRILGDDPFPSPESEQALRQIRDVVEGEWNVSNDGTLNPGYIRPLFLYAIETLQPDETQWAVAHLKKIKSPTSRSEFIASLGESLGRAQRQEKRRVTTKYFCNGTFNVMVPRM